MTLRLRPIHRDPALAWIAQPGIWQEYAGALAPVAADAGEAA